uniref:F-box domain-containing protein n=1 Tax=Lotus japonicus TaxID=34305 RepID=I3SVP4_LOTJA|nr:unknown [Lotus japonicus]
MSSQGGAGGSSHRVSSTRKRERPINPTDQTSLLQLLLPPSSVQKQSHLKQSQQNQAMAVATFLPDELVVEILSRLPVKSLLKFRCVCKSWMLLISDPYFIKKHLHLSKQSTLFNHHRIILSATTAEFHLKSCSVSSLFNSTSTVCEDLNYPVKNKYRHDGIVGSCNGLLCFAIKGDCVLLWNPSIRSPRNHRL